MKSVSRILLSVTMLLNFGALTQAQNVGNGANGGTPENAVFHGSDLDAIQTNNGSLQVVIPLTDNPGRGISSGWKYVYNNKGWHIAGYHDNTTNFVRQSLGSAMSWNLAGPIPSAASLSSHPVTQTCSGSPVTINSFTVAEADGTRHHLVPDPTGNAICGFDTRVDRYADDGSGWLLKGGGTSLYRRDGALMGGRLTEATHSTDPYVTMTVPPSIVDSNGNHANGTMNGSVVSYTDSLGRTVPAVTTTTDSSGNVTQTIPYYDASGTLRNVQVQMISISVATHLCAGITFCSEYSGTWQVPKSIALANGLQYSFSYDSSTGELINMTLPTGASIAYTYAQQFYGSIPDTGGRSVTSRKITVGGQSYTWNYTYSLSATSPAQSATVVDPLGNQTIYQCTQIAVAGSDYGTYDQAPCFTTEVDRYAGSGNNALLMKKVQTEYWVQGTVKPKAVTTTIYSSASGDSSVLKSRTETDYDTLSVSGYGDTSRGNVVETRDFSYDSSGNNPALVRRTRFIYLSDGSPQYLNINISNRVTDKSIYDCVALACTAPGTVGSYGTPYSGGKLVAETQYAYDDTTVANVDNLPAPPATVPGHDDSDYGTGYTLRGNPTHVKAWLNTSSAWLTTTNTYDVLGHVVSTTDPGNHTTSFSYSDDWNGWSTTAGCLPPLNSYAFLTDTKNALSQHGHTTYFPCTGQTQSAQDQNDINAQRAGTTYSYDSMKRTLSKNFADGGNTTFSYSDSLTDLSATETTKVTGSLNHVVKTSFDGLGRVVRTALTSDPDGTTYNDITYDGLGRKKTVTNPYRSTSDPTYGVTTYFYDALGRVTVTAPPDGTQTTNNISTQYGGNYTISMDQAGNQRKRYFDSLGRQIEVDEPQASSLGTSATASVTITGGLQVASSSNGVPPPNAAAGSAVNAYIDPATGTHHWVFFGTDHYLYQLYWNSNSGWGYNGGPSMGAPPAVSGSPLSAYIDPAGVHRWVYMGSNQHWYEVTWSPGAGLGYADGTAASGAPVAALNSALSTYVDSVGMQRWIYFGTDHNLYQLDWSSASGWGYGGGPYPTGALPAVSGSPLIAYIDPAGVHRWVYMSSNQHWNQVYWNPSTGVGYTDATAASGGPIAALNSALSIYVDPVAMQRWVYFGTDEYQYQLDLNSSNTWGYAGGPTAGAPPAVSGSPLSAYLDPAGVHRWVYMGSNHHLYELTYSPSAGVGYTDGTAASGAPVAALGSALSTYIDSAGTQHWVFLGGNQHLYQIYWNSSSGWGYTDATAAAPNEVTDSGVVSLNVGGFVATACYGNSSNSSCAGQSVNNTASQVASALAMALNSFSSPVTATASGTTITMTWKTPGPINPAISALSTTHDNSSLFTSPSFTSPATNFSGGTAGTLSNPYITLYSYDVLGNLLSVNQKGDGSQAARLRTFTYDSLSRITQSSNPETGTINFTYDADGNLTTKDSPKPNQTSSSVRLTINYTYDALHRHTGVTYSNGDPAVTYYYDQSAYNGLTISNGVGHRTGMSDGSGATAWSFDSEGRVRNETRTIAGLTKSIGYTYNLDGSTATISYPSGSTLTYTPASNGVNSAGRVGTVVDIGNSINYVTGTSGPGSFAHYAPNGSATSFLNGYAAGFAGITNTFSYNTRLQPVSIQAASPTATVFNISYDFHLGNGDNGNVYQLINNKDNTRSQVFTYDSLNRITSGKTSDSNQWGNTYGYDPWGNLLQKNQIGGMQSGENFTQAALANNQLTGFSYDAAGNTTFDGLNNYGYDGENRIISAAGITYTYDGEGERVKKSNGRLYWLGALAESDLSGNLTAEYIFAGGQRVARRDLPSGTVHYYFTDHLKSVSLVTNSSGGIEEESDYYPWGGERSITHTLSDQHFKFNGKERDPETGFDDFGARFYSNAWGRWLTPDWSANPTPVPYAQMDNPQSLNLYAYVANNPTTFPDLDGHFRGLQNPSGESLSQGDDSPEEDEVQKEIEKAKQELIGMGATYLIAQASQGPAVKDNKKSGKKKDDAHPCRTANAGCYIAVTSDTAYTPNDQGEMATRDIEYQVKNALGQDVRDVEVRLVETIVAGKEDNKGICSPSCSNKKTPQQEDFRAGQFHDEIHVDLLSRRSFSVRQQFFVDGGQVAIHFGESVHYSQTVEVRNDAIIVRADQY